MGQAWCKERTTKAQDSKSPLDRVFVRCAHQIYPTLKQDGSVLGGATQRVTSSEIGYAGSPPREVLTRGQSVDSIDRPFHPSDWVDVNLEVPSTPSSVITNLTANTSLYQTTTLSSTGSNLKNVTPIPPPRRRRKNRGRPLPPKPDEIIETHGKGKLVKSVKKVEPLYSSVKSPKTTETTVDSGKSFAVEDSKPRNSREDPAENDSKKRDDEGKNENKVNGTARTPKQEDRWTTESPRDVTMRERNYHRNKGNNNNNEEDKGNNQDPEYERFSKSREMRSSSTPNGPGVNPDRDSTPGRDLREFISRAIMDDDDILSVPYHRPKNYSTVSFPNYDELEVVKKEVERDAEDTDAQVVSPKKPGRARHVSTTSLPLAQVVSSLPHGATDRLEKYMTRCRSFGSLQPHEILDKLKAHGEQSETSDEDGWGGLDDWDLGVIDDYVPGDGRPPLEPNSRLRERKTGGVPVPKFKIGEDEEQVRTEKVEVLETPEKPEDRTSKNETDKDSLGVSSIPRNASFDVPKSPTSLKSALKLEANRKMSVPAKLYTEKPSQSLEDWFSAQESSVRFFDVPKLEEEYKNTPGHIPEKPSVDRNPEAEYDTRSYPFNGVPTGPLDIDTFFTAPEDFGGTTNSTEPPGRPKNVLTRSLSNESEPFDGYEEKELTLDIRTPQSSMSKLSRTISDESLPSEMAGEDDSLSERNGEAEEKAGDSKTPPPSPEPKIRAEILELDHPLPGGRPTTLKIPRDEEAGSNLSSMTPSLTELEAALSDMLEKEDHENLRTNDEDHVEDSEDSNLRHTVDDNPIEPKILPKPSEKEKNTSSPSNPNLFVRRRKDNVKISLGQILNDVENSPKDQDTPESPRSKIASRITDDVFKAVCEIGKKVPGRNPFEESDEDSTNNEPVDSGRSGNPFEAEPPEKPSRLHRIPLDQSSPDIPEVPTPPQRKNKHSATSPTNKTSPHHSESEFPIRDSTPHPNDRLI